VPAPTPPNARPPSVLIVDESDESRQVFETALNRRGVTTLTCGHVDEGLELARQHRPHVVVLDAESTPPCATFWQEVCESEGEREPALVILGALKNRADSTCRNAEFIAKPYHFRPLILKIEAMIKRTRAAA